MSSCSDMFKGLKANPKAVAERLDHHNTAPNSDEESSSTAKNTPVPLHMNSGEATEKLIAKKAQALVDGLKNRPNIAHLLGK